ncbi:winged helix DNA-binding protein [Romboutsia sp. CE17]|uniref:MarR family winged helix-turn-helix transcriptional regulator n=1 Tax=Romboutsia sp. CE17 TaxID=2724150 RepID=UPI001442E39D|nr:winged helix DNA-binding protein [Romboutsia sp. CE17]QJA07504.1 winged helix DNA-binding protein [Romboutsia sp. CE17]
MGVSDWIYMMEKMHDIKLFSRLLISRSIKENEIPSQHLELLSCLAIRDEKMTSMKLSKVMGLDKTVISRIIDTLSKSGYLTKTKDENDKRSYFISITKEGREKLDSTYAHYLGPIYELRRKLGEEEFIKMMSYIEKSNIEMLDKGKGMK